MAGQGGDRHEAAFTLATGVILTVAVCALYAPMLHAPFIFDDRPGIVDNPSLRRLWPPVGDERVRGPLNPPPLAPTARRPLPNLSFALNYRLGGLDPFGYRLVNVLLHALTAAVLAAVVRRTLRLAYFEASVAAWAAPLALAVALLWAIHPLVTEAVAYVTQRTEILGALSFLTTLWAALRYWTASSAGARRGWLAVAVLANVAGMASKEIMAAMPLVVLLYERSFRADSWPAVRRSWPLHLGLAAGWSVLVLLSVGGIGGLSDARHQVPLLVWWATQAKMVFLYLKLAVWPWPLSIHYAPAYLTSLGAAAPWVVALLALAAATIAGTWRRPAARFVVAAVVMVLAPTLVVPLPKMMAAERRMYLPLAGLLALVVVGVQRRLAARRPAAVAGLGVPATVALVMVLAAVSTARLGAYASATSIWRAAVAHQPADPMAHYNLGVALLDEGGAPADALAAFEEAVRLDPDYPAALDNLGLMLNRLGRPEEAQRHLERALALDRDDVVALNNLGIALTQLGRPAEALPYLQKALEREPEKPKSKVHVNLGNALLALGHGDEALAHFERAVRDAPDDGDARYSLGFALMRLGQSAEAIAALEEAIRLAPDDGAAHGTLGTVLVQSGQIEQAVAQYRRALALRPEDADLESNLGTALALAGKRDEAIVHFEAALRRAPDHANARRNLGAALLEAGRAGEAIAHFERAVRLDPDDPALRFNLARAYAGDGRREAALAAGEAARAAAEKRSDEGAAAEIAAWIAALKAEEEEKEGL